MKIIKRKIEAVKCLDCGAILSWDSFGCSDDGKVAEITCWCTTCQKHFELHISAEA